MDTMTASALRGGHFCQILHDEATATAHCSCGWTSPLDYPINLRQLNDRYEAHLG